MSNELEQAKRDFLDRLQVVRPPSVRFISWVSLKLRVPGFVAILVTCAVPFGMGALIGLATGVGIENFTVFWLRLNLFMITAGAFILLDFIYKRTLEALEAAVGPIEDAAELAPLEASFKRLFWSRAQTIFVTAFVVPAMFTLLVLLRLPFEGLMWAFVAIYTLLASVLLTTGLWSAFGLIQLSGTYGRLDSVRLNLIEPLDTVGVRQMAQLSTTWGICFAVQALFLLIGLWAAPWKAEPVSVFYTSAFWSAFLIAITALTFLYPKALIRPLVLRGKQRGLAWYQEQFRDCEERLGEIGLMELMRRERALGLLKEYTELQVRIAKARVSPLDIATMLKLAASVLVPAAVFMGQNPEILEQIGSYIRRAMP